MASLLLTDKHRFIWISVVDNRKCAQDFEYKILLYLPSFGLILRDNFLSHAVEVRGRNASNRNLTLNFTLDTKKGIRNGVFVSL